MGSRRTARTGPHARLDRPGAADRSDALDNRATVGDTFPILPPATAPRDVDSAGARSAAPASAFRADERERSVRTKTAGSLARFERACRSVAGGVASRIRRGVRPYPLFFASGQGSRVTDVDGNGYVDYGLAWGPLILGHAPPEVVDAVSRQIRRGLTFGAQHDLEYGVAERLQSIIPCADSVCFANSGTEIVQVALRLARAATSRQLILKFEGHYHGWADGIFTSYHPTAQQIAESNGAAILVSGGQLPANEVLVAEWNDAAAVDRMFAERGDEIAAVICEPILCNSGCIPPDRGFLERLRAVTHDHGALLIFDEVITGFRVHLQGGQGLYGVEPDLATYAKAIGAGTALSVLAGKSRHMDLIASGQVVHAGTLNGSPIALAAADAALKILARDGGAVYGQLVRRGERLRAGLETLLHSRGLAVVTSGVGSVFQLSFMARPARTYRETMAAHVARYSDFAIGMLDEGVLVLPDGRWYLSTAHTDADIDFTLAAVGRVVA
jgi:glutamate-1-semialdehyde 2,1-aminomutase